MILTNLERLAKQTPNNIAYTYKDHIITYLELSLYSDALSEIINNHVPKKAPILVYGQMEVEMVIFFLACVKSGHPYIPVDAFMPLSRVKDIILSTEAGFILSSQHVPFSEEIKDIKVMGEGLLTAPSFLFIVQKYRDGRCQWHCETKPEDIFYIIFTSGSTGKPKGVQISYRNLEQFLSWFIRKHNLLDGMQFLNHAPFSFDLSVMSLYVSLVTGGTVHSFSKETFFNHKKLLQELKEKEINVWVSVPSFLNMYVENNIGFSQENFPNLHRFILCGEVFSKNTFQKTISKFPNSLIYNTYGPTETTVAVTSVLLNEQMLESYDRVPIGTIQKESGEVKVAIREDDGSILNSDGAIGEIIISGPTVSPGYLDQQQCASKFIECESGRYYRTGDAGYIEYGYLFYSGRLDNQIKMNGYRIEVEEIERVLENIPKVNKACVLPCLDEEHRCEKIAAFMLLEEGIAHSSETSLFIRGEMGKQLPSYFVPSACYFVHSFPTNLNGKIDRNRLREELLSKI